MSADLEPTEAVRVAECLAESMVELWRRAHEDVAPTISDEQMRGLLALESEQENFSALAERLGLSAASATRMYDRLEQRTLVRRSCSGRRVQVSLTGAGKCVLEATRQRRRQLLEQVVVAAAPTDRPVLRDALDQLYGVVSPLVQIPRSRSPL
ncbi:MarR family transcriptional regulator [Streptomyces bicolor]|uniref:MarR family transcriptional regulator n=1 Tax=Streptomyces bicolor TaxID=66874 RepID=UPI000690ECB8|nr:MarR family transcriptional regulator [Streptomyces bicolor]